MDQLSKISGKQFLSAGRASSGHVLSPQGLVTSPRIRTQDMGARIVTDVQDVIQIINDQEKKNFQLGVIFLIIAIVTWLTGLELVNSVLKGNEFGKPWFLAFLTGSCFMFNFIPEVVSIFKCLLCFLANDQAGFSLDSPASDIEPMMESNVTTIGLNPFEKPDSHLEAPIPLTGREILELSALLSVVYYSYNVLIMLALQYTSASNQTVLGSTTTMFTLFVGVYLNVDRFTLKKVVCVATSLAGVVLINVSESQVGENDDNKYKPRNPALGNLLAFLGAFSYALYLLIMKVKCGTGKKTTNERKLFGWVGVCTFIMGIPLLAMVHYLGIEKFMLPPSWEIFGMVFVNSVFSVLSDYVTILAMLLTSPLVTSLALTSSIPITIFVDFVILHVTGGNSDSSTSMLLLYGFGVLSILISVILININITSENELIEEVIEEVLEDAIRHDEVLSPVLSPYLVASNSNGFTSSPKVHDVIGVNRLTPGSIFKRKNKHFSSPLVPTPMNHEDSHFTLNASSNYETMPIQNANHHRNLYTIDNSLEDGAGELLNANLLMFGGVNHNYHVKAIESDTQTSPR